MLKQRFERTLGGEIALDLCLPCQGIWFDEYESAQITPGGILALFKLIHAQRDQGHRALADLLRCPRCRERLAHGLDIAKPGGQFNYHSCVQKHGRFTTFAQFLIEKGFVRQLTGKEIEQLAVRIGSIRCNGCGAPVDIRHDHACSHCRSPIAILDPQAVETALARYQQAEAKRTAVDVQALGDAIITREKEASRQQRERPGAIRNERNEFDVGDLLEAGIDLLLSALLR